MKPGESAGSDIVEPVSGPPVDDLDADLEGHGIEEDDEAEGAEALTICGQCIAP